jgi:hypothetical protein
MYKIPISLALDDQNHLSNHIDLSEEEAEEANL